MKKLIVIGICLWIMFLYSFVAYGNENILKDELDYNEIQKNIDNTEASEYDFEEEVNKVVISGNIDYTHFCYTLQGK